jgi:hypothetical protein
LLEEKHGVEAELAVSLACCTVNWTGGAMSVMGAVVLGAVFRMGACREGPEKGKREAAAPERGEERG